MISKLELPREPEKAVLRLPSFSSSITTETGLLPNSSQQNGHDQNTQDIVHPPNKCRGFAEKILPWPTCGRYGIRWLNNRHSKVKKSLPCALQADIFPLTYCWQWTPSQLLQQRPEVIADILSARSFHIFERLSFSELVKEASGLPSRSLESFRWQYNSLSSILYYHLLRNQRKTEKLLDVKESLRQIQSDPFIQAAIENTCHCLDLGRYSELKLNCLSRLMIEPLQKALHEVESAERLQQQLAILRIRFRQYYTPEVDWNSAFDTGIEFLKQLLSTEKTALAESISREDWVLFQQLHENDFAQADNCSLHNINARWRMLCLSVEECMYARAGVGEIDQLAQKFYSLDNYHSLTAVVQGIKASGISTQALQKFCYLIDSDTNFHNYRQNMERMENLGDSKALHFLLPAVIAAQRNDITVAKRVVNACSSYTVESSPPSETEKTFYPYPTNGMEYSTAVSRDVEKSLSSCYTEDQSPFLLCITSVSACFSL